MSTLSHVKQVFTSADTDEPQPYECQNCGARFQQEYYHCPECGGYNIDRTEWSS